MSRSIRALILQVAVLVLAAPLLANADVDCSKLDDDDAREECRERKVDRKTDDVDIDDVDCSKLDNDDARRRCRKAKIKN